MPSALETTQSHEHSEGEARVAALLRAHVPLSLLLDLADVDPHSRELYAMEQAS